MTKVERLNLLDAKYALNVAVRYLVSKYIRNKVLKAYTKIGKLTKITSY